MHTAKYYSNALMSYTNDVLLSDCFMEVYNYTLYIT